MPKGFHRILLAVQVACAAAPVQPKPEAQKTEAPPPAQLSRDAVPTHYTLALKIDPGQPRFSGTAEIDVTLAGERSFVWLHGKGLTVRRATVDGEDAVYEEVTPDGVARVSFAKPHSGNVKLRFEYDAPFDEHLTGIYKAHEAGLDYAFTQFEAVEARKAFPGFDDPQFKTPFDVTLTVPAQDLAIGNTQVVDEKVDGATRTTRYATTKPLPTYLLAWSVGQFDVVTPPPLPPNELRDHPLQVRGIAPKGRGAELEYALKAGNELLLGLERYFGIAYPYDKLDHLAVPDYPYGAMENAGAITYRESAILMKTDSAEHRLGIAGTMAHEMAHQWFGDLVTLRWWTDAWLNESFATWMGNRTVNEWNPGMQARVELLKNAAYAMNNDSLPSARAIRQPVERTVDIWNSFDNITYIKGATVLGMFERYLGPEKFRAAIHEYMVEHANGSGSTDELLAAFSKASGTDAATPFRTFLDQPGVPLVTGKLSCEGAPKLLLKQEPYAPLGLEVQRDRLWQIPVCARFPGGEKCTLLTAAQGELPLPSCPAWIVPNADASGYYRWTLDAADLHKLALDQLTLREKISLAQNLRAAVRSGAQPFADAMTASEPLARDANGEVATEPAGLVAQAERFHVDDPAPAQAYARKLYRPVFERLGWTPRAGESDTDRRLRGEVLGFLLDTARDPQLTAEAAKRGAAAFGKQSFDRAAVAPELFGPVLTAWVREGHFDEAVARLKATSDTHDRDSLIEALGHSEDPRALALLLDPSLHKNEPIDLLAGQFGERTRREAAWTWLQQNYDALVARVPENHAAILPYLPAQNFCDPQHTAQVEAFFKPRAEKVPSMPRNFAHAVEQAHICVATRSAQKASAEAFFAKK